MADALRRPELWGLWLSGREDELINRLALEWLNGWGPEATPQQLRTDTTAIWNATKSAIDLWAPPELLASVHACLNARDGATRALDELTDERLRTGIRAATRCFHGRPRLPTWHQTGPAPSVLLNAAYEIVPFAGRSSELQELHGWCDQTAPQGIGVLWGRGGQGKSRLAQEFITELLEQGWIAGMWAASAATTNDLVVLAEFGHPMIAVIDYAETAPDRVAALAARLGALDVKSRILCLARSGPDGDWFNEISNWPDAGRIAAELAAAAEFRLNPIGESVDLDSFHSSCISAFASVGGHATHADRTSTDVSSTALEVSFEAYLNVFGNETVAGTLEDRILEHEWRYLNQLV